MLLLPENICVYHYCVENWDLYNTYYSPKKVIMDCELPELFYVPNNLLYL